MCEKSDGMFQISQSERLRHQYLFFAQNPIEGLLPGDRARALFLRSELPLLVLSQIWNLVDTPHDNMLDPREFMLAMHLIQKKLQGVKVPFTIPNDVIAVLYEQGDTINTPVRQQRGTPRGVPASPRQGEVVVPQMTYREFKGYRNLFETLDLNRRGFLDASIIREVLMTSQLPAEQLSLIWDLSDLDRDGKMNCDEFTIACHLVMQSKKGVSLDGAFNVMCLLPNRMAKHDLKTRRRKLKELEEKKQKLLALREKRKKEYQIERERLTVYTYGLELLQRKCQLLEQHQFEKDFHQHSRHLDVVARKVIIIQAVNERLQYEQELIRQETARLIMEHQRLSHEVQNLEEQAEKLRKRRERNSLIKDLDPFHELHEQRREEKANGITQSAPEPDVVIPQRWDPFNLAHLDSLDQGLNGDAVFLDGSWPSEIWEGKTGKTAMQMTAGFEDNFLDIWNCTGSGSGASDGGSPDASSGSVVVDNLLFDEVDPVFRTIAVNAEDDEIWSSLPPEAFVQPEAEVVSLEEQLTSMREYIQMLSKQGGQLIMRDQPESRAQLEAQRNHDNQDRDVAFEEGNSHDNINNAITVWNSTHDNGIHDNVIHDNGNHDNKQYDPVSIAHAPSVARRDLTADFDKSLQNVNNSNNTSVLSEIKQKHLEVDHSCDTSVIKKLDDYCDLVSDYVSDCYDKSVKDESVTHTKTTGKEEHAEVNNNSLPLDQPPSEDLKTPPQGSSQGVPSGDLDTNSSSSTPVPPPRRRSSSKKVRTPSTNKKVPQKPPRKSLSLISTDSVASAASSTYSASSIRSPASQCSDLSSHPHTPEPSPLPQRPARRYTPNTRSSSTRSSNRTSFGTAVGRCSSSHNLCEDPTVPALPAAHSSGTSPAHTAVVLRNKRINRRHCESSIEPSRFDPDFPIPPPRTKRKSRTSLNRFSTSLDSLSFRRSGSLPFDIENLGTKVTQEIVPTGELNDRGDSRNEQKLHPDDDTKDSLKDIESDKDSGVVSFKEEPFDEEMDIQAKKLELDNLRNRFFKDSNPNGGGHGDSGGSAEETRGTVVSVDDDERDFTNPPGAVRIALSDDADDIKYTTPSTAPSVGHDSGTVSGATVVLNLDDELTFDPAYETNPSTSMEPTVISSIPEYNENPVSKVTLTQGKNAHDTEDVHTVDNSFRTVVSLDEDFQDLANVNQEEHKGSRMLLNLDDNQDVYESEPSSIDIRTDPTSSSVDDFDDFFNNVQAANTFNDSINSVESLPKQVESQSAPISKVILDLDDHQFVPEHHQDYQKTPIAFTPDANINLSTMHLDSGNDSVGSGNLLDFELDEEPVSSGFGTVLHLDDEKTKSGATILRLDDEEQIPKASETSRNSKVILNLDDHQFVPEIESHQKSHFLQRDPEETSYSAKHKPEQLFDDYSTAEPKLSYNTGSVLNSAPEIAQRNLFDDVATERNPFTDIDENTRHSSASYSTTDDLFGKADDLFSHTKNKINVEEEQQDFFTDIDNVISTSPKHEMSPQHQPRIMLDDGIPGRQIDVVSEYEDEEHQTVVDDSDLSDTEPTFQATFSPHQTNLHQNSDGEDSGITLVSYQHTTSTDTEPSDTIPAYSHDITTYSSEYDKPWMSHTSNQQPITSSQSGPALLSRPQPAPRLATRSPSPTPPALPRQTPPSSVTHTRPTPLSPHSPAPQHSTLAPNTPLYVSTDEQHARATSPASMLMTRDTPRIPRSLHGVDTRPDLLFSNDALQSPSSSQFVVPTGGVTKRKPEVITPSSSLELKSPTKERLSADDIEHERRTLIDCMKVRRKKVVNWLQEEEQAQEALQKDKTRSELEYEQRRKGGYSAESRTVDPGTVGAVGGDPMLEMEYNSTPTLKSAGMLRRLEPDVIPEPTTSMYSDATTSTNADAYAATSPQDSEMIGTPNVKDMMRLFSSPGGRPKKKGEIDSRSINQTEKVKEWNKKFSEADVTLFPQESQVPKGISTNYDVTEFHSEVESEKLDLERTKQQWEEKYIEIQKQGEMEKISKQRMSLKQEQQVKNEKYIISRGQPEVRAVHVQQKMAPPAGESAIDREIRLAQEREADMKREHGMLGKSQGPSNGFEEMTEADQASEMMKRTIIENEIQQQQQRENAYHQELPQHRVNRNKEQEQSEVERQEKEQERVNAHESIIEREIRLQRERDREISTSRRTVYQSHSQQGVSRVPNSQSEPQGLSRVASSQSEHRAASRVPQSDSTPDLHTSVEPPVASSHHVSVKASPSMPVISERRAASPNPTNMAAAVTSPPPIRYEEAISTKAHAGESRIARELREQREREEELRAHWHTMGVDGPMVTDSAPDTPYNMPEPEQKPVVGPSAAGMSKSESAHEVSSVSADQEHKQHMPSSVSIDSGLFRVHRVAPLKTPAGVMVPHPEEPGHAETPIEREIRLARDREEELRRQKGLPVPMATTQKQVMVSVSSTPPSQPIARRGGELRGSVQKLASGRIQKEIASQHSKELVLQNEGKIRSLSTDEVDHHNYVDIIPKEGEVAPPPQGSHREPNNAPRDTSVYMPSRGRMYSAPTFKHSMSSSPSASFNGTSSKPVAMAPTDSEHIVSSPARTESPVPHSNKSNGIPVVVANGTIPHQQTPPSAAVSHHATPPATVNHQSHPPTAVNHVPHRAASLHDPPKGQHYSIRRAQNPTGSRIEQELKEMRERENELRRSHNQDSASESSSNDLESSHAAAMLASANDTSEKGNRQRRSNLAAQWEKRITSDQ